MNFSGEPLRRVGLGFLSLGIASLLWIPSVHFFFKPDLNDYGSDQGIPSKARKLAARHLKLWQDPQLRAQEIRRMRVSNAEWDFMGRTFLVLSLANMSLREPSTRSEYLAVMDQILDETLRLEQEKGMFFFLMDYAKDGIFMTQPPRSLFLDGEIALMLGARQFVEEKPQYRPLLKQRIQTILDSMRKSPVLSGESYPSECWMFCNAVSLAAIRMADVLHEEDHSEFLKEWIQKAQSKLIDPSSGLLVSSFTFDGETLMDGPEGSSIWMAAHCLQIVDLSFAQDQYSRAKKELSGSFMGFGYAREWPRSWKGPTDVDSGPIIPILDISAGSSGLALVGASAFGDKEYFQELVSSLQFAAFSSETGKELKFHASNQVGDAVLLYSMVLGPLWQRVHEKSLKGHPLR